MTNKESNLVTSRDELFANYVRVAFPDAEREYSNIARSSVDVGVWLVGLSTAVLALILSSTSVGEALNIWAYRCAIIIFSLVVLLAVIQRILFHIVERLKWPISFQLRTMLLFLTDTTRLANDLQNYWTVSDIVKRLKDDFGVDYSFLIENNVPIDQVREAYNKQLEIHRKYEKEGEARLAKILCAHFGESIEKEKKYFGSGEIDYEKIRTKARFANNISFAADLAYYSSAIAFAIGIIILAIGAL